jgi:hypothetical protein
LTTWDVRAQVTAPRIATWRTLRFVTSDRSTTWDVRTVTTSTRETTWNVAPPDDSHDITFRAWLDPRRWDGGLLNIRRHAATVSSRRWDGDLE